VVEAQEGIRATLSCGDVILTVPIWGVRDPAKRIVMVFSCYVDAARVGGPSIFKGGNG
jgi:hypothetical protein